MITYCGNNVNTLLTKIYRILNKKPSSAPVLLLNTMNRKQTLFINRHILIRDMKSFQVFAKRKRQQQKQKQQKEQPFWICNSENTISLKKKKMFVLCHYLGFHSIQDFYRETILLTFQRCFILFATLKWSEYRKFHLRASPGVIWYFFCFIFQCCIPWHLQSFLFALVAYPTKWHGIFANPSAIYNVSLILVKKKKIISFPLSTQ